jgi:lipoate---protein ligase
MAPDVEAIRCEILIAGDASAPSSMERDLALLKSLESDPRIILHFYDWEQPSATYGYFIDPERYFNPQGLSKHGLQLARRPTGGGIIFHTCDLAFSLLIPANHPGYALNPLDSYAWINKAVLEAIEPFIKPLHLLTTEPPKMGEASDAFCMAKPTRYDILLEGHKVGGAAERRMRHGLLHQGSIALSLPDDSFLCDILWDQKVGEAMRQHSHALLGNHSTKQELSDARYCLRSLMIKYLFNKKRIDADFTIEIASYLAKSHKKT